MAMMFSVGTVMWTLATYNCLVRFPEDNLIKAASMTGLILLVVAVVLGYVFFGLIRGAMVELYHPTTLYGYAFVAVLPFLVIFVFRKRVEYNTKKLQLRNLAQAATVGAISAALLLLIIVFRLEI